MRTVFNNEGVAKEFLEQKIPFGRNPKRSFYFEGPVLYSYGKHFVVARFLPDGRLLVSARRDSHATNSHLYSLSRRLWVYNAPCPDRSLRPAPIRACDVHNAALGPEEEVAFLVNQVAAAVVSIQGRIRRPRDAVPHFHWHAVRRERALNQANMLGLPAPHLPELPEDCLVLRAVCLLRGYKV